MSAALSKEEKRRVLKALEEDEEFRYAVAGLIGVSETLKRLDRLEANQEKLWIELRELMVGVERLTLSVEEEARDVVRHRLRAELNVDVPLDRMWVDGREFDIYGATSDLCIIGEATVRLGVKLLQELEEKVNHMRERRPDLLRPKVIKVIYTDNAIPSALEEAKAKGVWVLKWSGDLTPRTIHILQP